MAIGLGYFLTERPLLTERVSEHLTGLQPGWWNVVANQDSAYIPNAIIDHDGHTILQFHQLQDGMVQQLVSSVSRAAEFPMAPAEDEAKLLKVALESDKSILLLGRSGTGKTTLLVHHMFDRYRQALACGSCCSQLFVTNNAVLASSVKKAFRGMQKGVAGVKATDVSSWEELEDRHWPLFLTKQDFLLFVNEHVETSFFQDKQWDATRDAAAVPTPYNIHVAYT